jgi:hypothetical protein
MWQITHRWLLGTADIESGQARETSLLSEPSQLANFRVQWMGKWVRGSGLMQPVCQFDQAVTTSRVCV